MSLRRPMESVAIACEDGLSFREGLSLVWENHVPVGLRRKAIMDRFWWAPRPYPVGSDTAASVVSLARLAYNSDGAP